MQSSFQQYMHFGLINKENIYLEFYDLNYPSQNIKTRKYFTAKKLSVAYFFPQVLFITLSKSTVYWVLSQNNQFSLLPWQK